MRKEGTDLRKRAVRELRQRRAYYRCCIPALAGFVSQRSIAPDGSFSMDQFGKKGNGFLGPGPMASKDRKQSGLWSFGLYVFGFRFSVVRKLKAGPLSGKLETLNSSGGW